MLTCMRCGKVGEADIFSKPRPKRRPECRDCFNRQQRESRYKRLNKRRRVGEPESFTCSVCQATVTRIVTPGPLRARCDECVRSQRLERIRPRYRAADLKKKYGLTPARVDQMLTHQLGRCAICGSAEPGGRHGTFHVDHDHATGKVRGLLCDGCNRGLGFFRDDPRALVGALHYLGANIGGPISWWGRAA